MHAGLSSVLRGRVPTLLSVLLAVQAVLYHTASGGEKAPPARSLEEFPERVGAWTIQQRIPIEQEVLDVLKADDTLSRTYTRPGDAAAAGLFVAYFKTQRTGQAPHSPKNCLPGSGWEPSQTGTIRIPLEGRAEPLEINRYIVSRGSERSLVLYWYQSRDRVIASEYAAKYWLVADSIRYHRSDTALVRVVVPVAAAGDEAASHAGIEFVQSLFPRLREFLPS